MPSILLKLADLGFTAQGCYREGDCDSCYAKGLTWFWHGSWRCDTCVLNSLLPEQPKPAWPADPETGQYSLRSQA